MANSKKRNDSKDKKNIILQIKEGKTEVELTNSSKNIIGLKDLRESITTIYSEAINDFKYFITGNVRKDNAKTLSILSTDVLNSILENFSFNSKISFDNETNQYEVIIAEIEAYGCGDTKTDAVTMVIENVIDLKDDFFENIGLYMRIDNMKKKYPYFLRINNCSSVTELLKTLNLSETEE